MSDTITADARTFAACLESLVDFEQSIISDREGPSYPENCRTVVIVERGRKYAKLINTGIADDSDRRSINCFVNLTTGEILNAASWKRPARTTRGNVFTRFA